MSLTARAVAEATRAWIFVPDTASTVETPEYLLVRFPEWADVALAVLRFEPDRAVPEVLDEVLARAAGTGLEEVAFWVKLGAPAGLEEQVRARGGTLVETLDVLALDLGAGVPDLGGSEVEVRWVEDVDVLRDSHTVLATVFGGAVPPPERLQLEAWQAAANLRQGLGGAVVAYRDGVPVGTGGLTLADGAARLWSGSVLAEHRGAGGYRAMLAERLRYGADRGAALALVKGRVETSGPILRRAGFQPFGQERCYTVPLPAG